MALKICIPIFFCLFSIWFFNLAEHVFSEEKGLKPNLFGIHSSDPVARSNSNFCTCLPGPLKGCQMDGSWGANKQPPRVSTPCLGGCWYIIAAIQKKAANLTCQQRRCITNFYTLSSSHKKIRPSTKPQRKHQFPHVFKTLAITDHHLVSPLDPPFWDLEISRIQGLGVLAFAGRSF